jgi:AraC-like DNA-binding protein
MGSMAYQFSTPPGQSAKARHPLWGGELTLEPGSSIAFEEGLAGPVTVVKATSSGIVGYRRSARAVRRHEQPFHILNFVDRGHISVSHSHETVVLGPGFISITKNSTAYIARLLPEAGQGVETYTLRVPDHLIAPYFPCGLVPGKPLAAGEGVGASARALAKLMFEHGAAMPEDALSKVLGALLQLVALVAQEGEAHATPRVAANERHFRAMERYIARNIADNNLSLAKVATELGVSTRYVSAILNERGLRFRDYLKDQRIGLARRLLADLDNASYTIAEIASLTGFSTASHFSTAFRQSTGSTPGEWRRTGAPAA